MSQAAIIRQLSAPVSMLDTTARFLGIASLPTDYGRRHPLNFIPPLLQNRHVAGCRFQPAITVVEVGHSRRKTGLATEYGFVGNDRETIGPYLPRLLLAPSL